MKYIVTDTEIKHLVRAAGDALGKHPAIIGKLVSGLSPENLANYKLLAGIKKQFDLLTNDDGYLDDDAFERLEQSNDASEWALEIHQSLVDLAVKSMIDDSQGIVTLSNSYDVEIESYSIKK